MIGLTMDAYMFLIWECDYVSENVRRVVDSSSAVRGDDTREVGPS